jgi:predicted regulator of Ras-like GTPase activity (Roadblock/LC7/MglB family)
MIHDIILSREDAFRLNVLLTRLIDNSRADCIMLINKSGRLITSQSESSDFDKTSLAALIAGAFASTTAIANMIGESEFRELFHQGKKRNTFICLVDDNTILTALFDKRTTVEKLRHFVKMYTDDLIKTLQSIYSKIESNPYINVDVGAAGRKKAR